MVSAPVPFTTPDGRITGWKTTIPGRRPLATPAVAHGRVFLGGGFGSHEFYAFDAGSGAPAWEYHTKDDGPTAAIVADGLVAFNTESCELEVLTTEGRPVWKQWLGDPLMSMPASDGGRIFMAFPNSRGDRRHHLACFDLRTGREHWRTPIVGEIITAPVLADGQVYLTTLEGTVACFRADDGGLVWQEPLNATSSPAVWNKQCYFSRREEATVPHAGGRAKQQTEQLAARGLGMRDALRGFRGTTRYADYLDHGKRKARSPYEMACQMHDAHVGFAYSKGDAKMHQAMNHLGHGSVYGVWAYQGSKPFVYRDRLYSAMGDTLKCVDPRTEEVLWKKPLFLPRSEQAELLDSVLTPPALVNGKVFVATTFGEVHCLSADSGENLWTANLGEPVVFQPAVAGGRVYVATYTGNLFCLNTGDPADDGWAMWGGSAAHNGAAPALAAV
jgi:Ca-activated chloride channel family protein